MSPLSATVTRVYKPFKLFLSRVAAERKTCLPARFNTGVARIGIEGYEPLGLFSSFSSFLLTLEPYVE